MELVTVADQPEPFDASCYSHLENGNALFFPKTPITFTPEELEFLLGQRQSGAAYHKNIAYRPSKDLLTGVAAGGDRDHLKAILRKFSQQSVALLTRLLPRYAASWRVDFTSFRPLEEAGRQLSVHSRNDLLHVDAFPTRPTNGDRILRFFTNINPTQSRVWNTTDSFEVLVEQLSDEARLTDTARSASSSLRRSLAGVARGLGLRQFGAAPYDILMHRLHNFMKENQKFQDACRKDRWEFPPSSSWMVFTDAVGHSVLSGQFALEQTFIIAHRAMQHPERAPVSVLERITGMRLTWAQ